MTTIVCIGAGGSAALLAWHLHAAGFSGRIILVDSQEGYGAAYSTHDHRHLLNVPAANMGASEADKAAFWRFLAAQGLEVPPEAFVPRLEYGHYLERLIAPLRASGQVIRIQDRAWGLERRAGFWQVALERRRALEPQAVVLAVGNLPPSSLPGGEVVDTACYVDEPWRCRLEEVMAGRSRILFVGTGLTMVDGVISLADHANIHMTAISRHGLLPLPWKTQEAIPVRLPESMPGPRAMLRFLREAAAGMETWEMLINGLRPQVQAIWQSWTLLEQARFLRHALAYWNIHRHRISDAHHALLSQMQAAGRLTTMAGHVLGIEQQGSEVLVRWRPRGEARECTARFDVVVNCTGPASDYRRMRDPLVLNLLGSGNARSHPLGMGLAASPRGEVLDAKGQPVPGLFALGPPLRGVLFECTAIPDIRKQAALLARHMVAWLAQRPAPADAKEEMARKYPDKGYQVLHDVGL